MTISQFITKVYFVLVNRPIIRLFDALFAKERMTGHIEKYDLVITRFDRIGDFVMGLDGLSELLRRFKGKRIMFICGSITYEIVNGCGLFTDVLKVDGSFKNRVIYHARIVKRLRSIDSEYIINPVWARIEPGDVVVKLIHSHNKYGCDGDEKDTDAWIKGNSYYTKLIPQSPFRSEFLATQYFINNTINPAYKASLPRLDTIFSSNKSIIPDDYAFVSISASGPMKIWPMERLASIVDTIPEKYKVVLSGSGNADVQRVRILMKNLTTSHRIINLVNKTSIWQMFNLVANSKFVIGMDSAAVHIAAAARVRSVCIGHGAHYQRFLPYPEELGEVEFHPRTVLSNDRHCFSCGYSCTRDSFRTRNQPLPCLLDVSVDAVGNELEKLLREI